MSRVVPSRPLDLCEIQGNVIRGYRFPVARHLFLRVQHAAGARVTVRELLPHVTTAQDRHHDGGHWSHGVKPRSALNVAFTWRGLEALGVPQPALWAFPPEFRAGMRARADVLVDIGHNAPARWDAIWQGDDVHMALMLNAATPAALDEREAWLLALVSRHHGFLLVGRQDAAMETDNGRMREHFGFLDGFGNPEIAGAPGRSRPGRGKISGRNGWAPLAPGEFLLGYRNEAGEVAPTPQPSLLFRNGTFMVYRKLHQNVGTFRRFLREEGARYPGGPALLAAKLMGRWPDGTPLALSPDHPDPRLADDDQRNTDFRYGDDPQGARCPLGAHTRRANPRDGLGFGGLTVNRRRIIRRGIPYGAYTPPDAPGDDHGEHGLLFIAFMADFAEQFEFIQQQWMNYGNDFALGNDADPVVATRTGVAASGRARHLITGDAVHPTYSCVGLPQFVETRGGDYFFVPALAALDIIAGPAPSPATEAS